MCGHVYDLLILSYNIRAPEWPDIVESWSLATTIALSNLDTMFCVAPFSQASLKSMLN